MSSQDKQNPEQDRREQKYLLVGLGNPGRKHRANRHSIGFMLIDQLADSHQIELSKVQHKAMVGMGRLQEYAVVLAKPQTYMNLSGDSVGPLANYYRIPTANVLVIYDELDLPLGTIRLRAQGGAGGHNGMKSIIQHLGQEFPRLRLGIGRPPGQMPPAAYVLQDFGKGELEIVADLLRAGERAVETFLSEGIEGAMSRHNGTVVETD